MDYMMMYKVNPDEECFNSISEAKDRVDQFLDKLLKLKAFV